MKISINHIDKHQMYDQDCVFMINGEALSKSDAIDHCQNVYTTAKVRNCLDEYHEMLDCIVREEDEDCNSCGHEFDDYNDCMAN